MSYETFVGSVGAAMAFSFVIAVALKLF